jgi:hypothetical protein
MPLFPGFVVVEDRLGRDRRIEGLPDVRENSLPYPACHRCGRDDAGDPFLRHCHVRVQYRWADVVAARRAKQQSNLSVPWSAARRALLS